MPCSKSEMAALQLSVLPPLWKFSPPKVFVRTVGHWPFGTQLSIKKPSLPLMVKKAQNDKLRRFQWTGKHSPFDFHVFQKSFGVQQKNWFANLLIFLRCRFVLPSCWLEVGGGGYSVFFLRLPGSGNLAQIYYFFESETTPPPHPSSTTNGLNEKILIPPRIWRSLPQTNFGLTSSMVSVLLGIVPLYTTSLTLGGLFWIWVEA